MRGLMTMLPHSIPIRLNQNESDVWYDKYNLLKLSTPGRATGVALFSPRYEGNPALVLSQVVQHCAHVPTLRQTDLPLRPQQFQLAAELRAGAE
jgi:hypothetical protein